MQHLEITSDALHVVEKCVLRRGFPGAKKAATTETSTDQASRASKCKVRIPFCSLEKKESTRNFSLCCCLIVAGHFDSMITWIEVCETGAGGGGEGHKGDYRIRCTATLKLCMPGLIQVPPTSWSTCWKLGELSSRRATKQTALWVSGNQVFAVQNTLLGHPRLPCSIPAAVAYLLRITPGVTAALPGNEGQRSCEEPFVTLRGLVEMQ